MSRHSKSVALIIPAVASLLSLAISTSALAQRAGHRGAVAEQDNTVNVDENTQDQLPRHRGEQARAEPTQVQQVQAPQPQAVQAQETQIIRQAREQPEHMREENNGRNNPRIELVRQQQERENTRQRQQDAQQNAQNAAIAERAAAGQRLAMQRNNADNARQNREGQNERADFRGENRNGRGEHDNNDNHDRDHNANRGNPIARKPYPQPDQRQWQEQQQRQANEYRHHLDGQQSTALRIVQNLRHQNRNEQYRSQQRYYDRMNDQRRYYDNNRDDDYYRGSYQYSPVIYRYNRGGNYYYANRYQADLMRQAINYGYEEGYYAGRADRMDRWGFNYRDAYAYQDANYGYGGYYVDRGTYNYYFRQGFSRGYDDGYYSRDRYGRHYNNNYSLNDSVFRLILNFSNWR